MSGDVDAMVAWLRAQWDADEQAVREIGRGVNWRQATEDDHSWKTSPEDVVLQRADGSAVEKVATAHTALGPARGAHIARHDPRDTLARIDGERALVAAYEQRAAWAAKPGVGDRSLGCLSGLETAVRALASGYRHRAGWQEGWAT